MRDNNIISILDVLLTETTLVTKANPGSVRIWDRYRRGPRFVRILDWSNLGPPHRRRRTQMQSYGKCLHRLDCSPIGLPSPEHKYIFLHPLHLSRSLVDRWGATDDLATSSLHSSRLSAFLMAAPSVMPDHSGMLSSHLFFCLPLLALCPAGLSWQAL